jgi:hypothetical protein
MLKSKSKYYNGQECVEISSLPYGQSSLFSEWLSKRNLSIFLRKEDNYKLIRYDFYDYWFESIYINFLINDFDA